MKFDLTNAIFNTVNIVWLVAVVAAGYIALIRFAGISRRNAQIAVGAVVAVFIISGLL